MTGRVSGGEKVSLPDDPDLDVAETPKGEPRPIHLRPGPLAVVFAGGALGTAARAGLVQALPAVNGIPLTVLGINVLGAFILGVLLDVLARRGPDHGQRRTLRLLLGTGFMGGFTTYSALAADTAALIGGGSAGTGIAYAVATVLVGAAASWAGIAVGGGFERRRSGARP